MRRVLPLLLAIAAVAAVIIPYVALGGASYEPARAGDPCETREWRDPGDLEAVFEQIVLSAFDGAACELDVSREELVLAMRDEAALDAFARERNLDREDAERAISDGFERAIDDAEEAGALPSLAASLARRAVDSLPPWLVLEALESLRFIG